jgi:type IV secretion system protein TrbL
MVTPMRLNKSAALVAAFVLLYSTGAAAQLSFHDSATNQGILDQVVTEFATRASGWQAVVMDAAMWLFWTLGGISLTWTGGMMFLRRADLGEFFAEFIRFILFFGFFLWLLRNGPDMADAIIRSLRQLGENAIGVTGLSPSGIVDVGFMIWKQAVINLSAWSPIDSFVGVVLSAGILILLAVIAVNMLQLLVSAWILMYAGIFYLGFGGSRWTSDMAINYYKTVLGVAVSLFAMVLLIGIGNDLVSSFYAKMTKDTLNFEELGVMLVFCVALLLLIKSIPPLLAGIITGGSIGGGIGNFGVGEAFGAAGMAAAAVTTGGAALAAGAASAVGGAQALMAAVSKASENVAAGSDVLSNFAGGATDSSASGTSTGSTPLAEAAGISAGRGMLATVGRITADATANLAKGATEVAKTKASSMKTAAMDRIAETTGGQIATAIRQAAEPTFEENSLAAAPQDAGPGSADPESEVAAFVNRSPQPEF